VHIGSDASTQPDRTTRQIGGQLEMTQALRWLSKAQRRAADGKVRVTGQLGARGDQGQDAAGCLVRISTASLNEP
jgi:hypothetical protein